MLRLRSYILGSWNSHWSHLISHQIAHRIVFFVFPGYAERDDLQTHGEDRQQGHVSDNAGFNMGI